MPTTKDIEIIEEDKSSLFSKVNSCGLIGVNAYTVEIEVDISSGLPNFILVGLPDAAINESKERVRAAIKSSGFEFPSKKIIVNLAPADTKKAGPTYDLPIATGILASNNTIDPKSLENIFIAGELGLSGIIRPVSGILSFTILAKEKGAKGIIIPKDNAFEASLIEGINIFPVSNLAETVKAIRNIKALQPLKRELCSIAVNEKTNLDLCDVKGQFIAKRALEILAAGQHHLLMIGPPGSGKSMLAQRVLTILPQLTHEEKIEVTQIYSAAGKLTKDTKLITNRPFRSPHHNISTAGLIGGGSIPQPGEISLAHKGVLFLDEFTEFQKNVLDSLRQAIETKEITISRSKRSCSFPSDFTLIAACNPCPCSYYRDNNKKCKCPIGLIKRYLGKISGPIIDRIDLQVEVKRLSSEELLNKNLSKSSSTIKDSVLKALELQNKRYKGLKIATNSSLSPHNIRQFCTLSNQAEKILAEAIKNLHLTGRGFDRILKVSRTIADLENSDIIKDEHLLEALQFRLSTFINV